MGVKYDSGMGVLLGAALVGSGLLYYNTFFSDRNKSDVSSGYVVPHKFDIRVKNLDDKGKDEVIAIYNGRNYLFMLDGNGKPVLRDYKINPSSGSSKLEILAESK